MKDFPWYCLVNIKRKTVADLNYNAMNSAYAAAIAETTYFLPILEQ